MGTKAHENVGNSGRGRSQAVPKIFRAPICRAHCAVVFAIAQLSCFCIWGPSPHLGTAMQTTFSPLSFGKSFMKIRSAVPENGCLIFFDGRKKQEKKKKNICKTYTHPPHRRLRKWGQGVSNTVAVANYSTTHNLLGICSVHLNARSEQMLFLKTVVEFLTCSLESTPQSVFRNQPQKYDWI